MHGFYLVELRIGGQAEGFREFPAEPPAEMAAVIAEQELATQFKRTGAFTINRPCAQQYVGKSQSCMVENGRLIVHAPVLDACAHAISEESRGLT